MTPPDTASPDRHPDRTVNALVCAERPAGRRGVVRRSRVIVDDRRVTVRVPGKSHTWPIGDGGVASAVHVRQACPLDGVRERGGQALWQKAAAEHIVDSAGCLHLCDAQGGSLVCLLPNDWVPDGSAPVGLATAGSRVRAEDLKPDEYLRLSGFSDLLAARGIPVRRRPDAPAPAETGSAGTVRPGPYETGTWKFGCALWAFFAAALTAPLIGLFAGRSQGDRAPFEAASTGFAAVLLLLGAATWGLPALRRALAPSPGKAVAVLRPIPGTTVTRAFARRTRLVSHGEELMLRNAQGVERWLRGPADPIGGVSKAVVLSSPAGPVAVALVDRRKTVLALLPWETWFAGDGGEVRLTEFCEAAGIPLRHQTEQLRGPKDFRDRSAMPWGRKEYGERHALFAPLAYCTAFGVFACVTVVTGLSLGSAALTATAAAAAVLNLGAPTVRHLVRRVWLNQPVAAVRDHPHTHSRTGGKEPA